MSAADLGEAKQRLINYFPLVTAEETFRSLELSWTAASLTVHAGRPIGTNLWAGRARNPIVGRR